jgi:hypothetical protein
MLSQWFMRWSIKSLLLVITAFCMSLALTWLPPKSGAVVLLTIVTFLRLKMSFAAWWRMTAGAVICVALSWAFVIHKCLEYYASTLNEAVTAPAFFAKWLPYAIQLGAFVGGSLGLLLYNRKKMSRKEIG